MTIKNLNPIKLLSASIGCLNRLVLVCRLFLYLRSQYGWSIAWDSAVRTRTLKMKNNMNKGKGTTIYEVEGFSSENK